MESYNLWFSLTRLFLFSIMFQSSSNVSNFIPFYGQIKIPFYEYTTFSLSIHQLIDIRLFAALNDVTMNIRVQVSVWTCVFISLVYMPA